MNFTYDKTKKYELTNDIYDVENWVCCRIPMLMKPPFSNAYQGQNLTEDEVINKISLWLFYSATFEGIWKKLGADDVRQLPTEYGLVMTALKNGEVLKQTTFVM